MDAPHALKRQRTSEIKLNQSCRDEDNDSNDHGPRPAILKLRDEFDEVSVFSELGFENNLAIPSTNVEEPSRANRDEIRNRRLNCRTESRVTALYIKIEGLDTLNLQEIANFMPELYHYIEVAASVHGAVVAERRCDSFILKSVDDEEITSAGASWTIARMLALATDLECCLRSTRAHQVDGFGLSMGMACGSMTLLGNGSGASWTACSVVGVRGDAADLAEEMAGVGAAGAVTVHESALWRWAATARQPPPPSTEYSCAGGERRRAATFDLSTLSFHPPSTSPPTAHVPRRLTRSSSYS